MSVKKVPTLENFSWQLPVKDKDLSSPPASPTKGDRYIVAATGSGLWSGHTYDIALCTVGGGSPSWEFVTETEGMIAWVEDENLYYKFNGLVWGLLDVVKNDGSVNPTNFLYNGDFKFWSAGDAVAPDGWTLGGTSASIAKESTIIKLGTYSIKLTRAGTNCYAYQNCHTVRGIEYWKGRTVTFGCWVYATVASSAYISLDDSAESVSSRYHSGNSTWEWLTITKTIASGATRVRLYTYILNNDTSAYFDGAMGVEGESSFAFSEKPVILGNNSENIPTTFVGKVGIGTTTPSRILQVIGNCCFGDEADNVTTIFMRRNATNVGGISSYNSQLSLFGGAEVANHFYIDSNGYVYMPVAHLSIGTTIHNSNITFPTAGSMSVDTVDGSDTGNLMISGGGAAGAGRGAWIQLDGNERGNPGDMFIQAGAVSGAEIRFYTGGVSDVMVLDDSGRLIINGLGVAGTAKLDVFSDIIRLRTAKTPATSGAAGNAGDICWDSSYIYVCIASSTWRRASLSSW